MIYMKRNDFIKTAWLGAYLIPTTIPRFNFDPKQPLDKTLVEEFVGAAHRDKTKVMALLAETPNLLNAAHDWGSGDFETALGAASHVGYMELVTYLKGHTDLRYCITPSREDRKLKRSKYISKHWVLSKPRFPYIESTHLS